MDEKQAAAAAAAAAAAPVWKTFVMPFGKHKGKTIDTIRHSDFSYCVWAEQNLTASSIAAMFKDAVDHQEKTDAGAFASVSPALTRGRG
jgi:hypothetical protein